MRRVNQPMIETCVSARRQAGPRPIPIVITLAIIALAASEPHSAFAWSTASTPAAAETAACSELEKSDFSQTQDAPAQITSAKMVEASGTAGSFCKVEAYVYPQVGIEIHLPLAKDWNGKLITTGNGGWAGSIYSTACDTHLKRGYACVTTDTGHRGGDGMWAANNDLASAGPCGNERQLRDSRQDPTRWRSRRSGAPRQQRLFRCTADSAIARPFV